MILTESATFRRRGAKVLDYRTKAILDPRADTSGCWPTLFLIPAATGSLADERLVGMRPHGLLVVQRQLKPGLSATIISTSC